MKLLDTEMVAVIVSVVILHDDIEIDEVVYYKFHYIKPKINLKKRISQRRGKCSYRAASSARRVTARTGYI